MDKRTNTFNMVIILSIVVMATYAQQVRLRRPIGSIVGMFLGRFNPRRGPDRGGLQRTLESLRGYQDRGISLVQLRRRSRLIDSVIRWMEERNREDPVNPGKYIRTSMARTSVWPLKFILDIYTQGNPISGYRSCEISEVNKWRHPATGYVLIHFW